MLGGTVWHRSSDFLADQSRDHLTPLDGRTKNESCLVPQPDAPTSTAYSSKLDPMEQIILILKSNGFANRVFKDVAA